MAALGLTSILLGCTVTSDRPIATLEKVREKWQPGQEGVVRAHGVGLTRLPFTTFTLSASESWGVGAYGTPAFIDAGRFEVPARKGQKLRFEFNNDGVACQAPDDFYALLADATRATLGRLRTDRVPAGTVRIYLLRDGPFFAKRVYALRGGRRIDVSLYYACDSTEPGVATFHALATTLHELTHLMLRLQAAPRTRSTDEFLADYAPACLYEALGALQRGPALITKFPAAAFYAASIYHAGDIETPNVVWSCRAWVESLNQVRG